MTILMIGDVVGSPGRRILKKELKKLKESYGASAAVVNAENCAAGSGITELLAKEIFSAGADAITLGDHTWGQKEFAGQIGRIEKLVRPANFPSECPGRGWCIVTLPSFRFAVLNLQGRVFMQSVDCPFKAADLALREIPADIPVVVDFHAEATSEKVTLANYLDGRISALVGTHTHVQTADERIIDGCGFITDIGMSGPRDSIIGVKADAVLELFLTKKTSGFETAEGEVDIMGAIFEFDSKHRCISVERFKY